MMKNEKGSTLAEVMIAFVILLMASQLLLSGSAAARKMERRADEISNAADMLREQLTEDSNCLSGTLRLKIDENTDEKDHQGADAAFDDVVLRHTHIITRGVEGGIDFVLSFLQGFVPAAGCADNNA